MQNGKDNDNFWNLGDFKSQRQRIAEQARKANFTGQSVNQARNGSSHINTSAVEISDNRSNTNEKSIDKSETVITKFVPPHSDPSFKKKHVVFEYEPQNPFIKCVRFLSEREGEALFSTDNLFMRERTALLERAAVECEYVPFYSYAPRYSQLTKPQLKYYLWWRENARRGVFLKADESYIMLYAYELAATTDGEDKHSALSQLCFLLTDYPARQPHIVIKTMIRDIICDFCLVHGLTPPWDRLSGVERQVINNSFLPEMFIDLNVGNDSLPIMINASMSLYDYTKSKFYPENEEIFDKAILGALYCVIRNKESFDAITSFTRGVYGSVTSERHPFGRMVNIVNKSISIEITYFELGNIRPAITDIVRYSENKLREHLGIKNKISIMSVNPVAKTVIDTFFDANYPPRPAIDRRRRNTRIDEFEVHDYDKLYELPKTQLSPERALEIERESWNTTKILTEAFSEDQDIDGDISSIPADIDKVIIQKENTIDSPNNSNAVLKTSEIDLNTDKADSTYLNIKSKLGEISEFIKLCKTGVNITEQRKFALAHGMGTDEIADNINEAALDFVGDIILENNGMEYTIIEDYRYLFDDL